MKKIAPANFFRKSIWVFLVCLAVWGGMGDVKNAEAGDKDILVYPTADSGFTTQFFILDLESLGFTTAIKFRNGANELTNGTINLSDYGQVWIIDSGSGADFTAEELSAIETFRNNCGGLLLSVDHDAFQNRVNPVTKKFNNGANIFYGSQSTIGICHSPSFTVHPLYSGLNKLSSSISDACFNIQNSNIEITVRNNNHNGSCGGSDVYGAVLDEDGKGRIVFDSAILRFFIVDSGDCDGSEKSQYQQNIAEWLDVCVSSPTCTLTANPSSIYSGDSSILTWTTENATSVAIDNGVASTALNDSESVSPISTTTYKLTATNASGATITCSTVVTVGTPLPAGSCGAHLGLFCNPLRSKTNSFAESAILVALYLLSIIGIITLLFIVIAGIRYILSYGNEENMKSAKDAFSSAGLGLIIALLAYSILSVIQEILNK